MTKLDRESFENNLWQAFECADVVVNNEDVWTFLDYNFDEDGTLPRWMYADFYDFADTVKNNDFWFAVEEFGYCDPTGR